MVRRFWRAPAVLLALAATCYSPAPLTRPLPGRVVWSEQALDDIARTYEFFTKRGEVEFARCLYGSVEPDGVYVDLTIPPVTLYAGKDSISTRCVVPRGVAGEHLGRGHSHPVRPYDNCVPSVLDVRTFLRNPSEEIAAVFCSDGRIHTVFRPPSADSILGVLDTLDARTAVYFQEDLSHD